MRVIIEEQSDALILRVDHRHALSRMLRRDRIAFIQKNGARSIQPSAQNRVQREMPPPQVLIKILRIERVRTFESNLPGLIPDVQLRDVALFGDLDALLVGKDDEVPENAAAAFGSTVVKAIASPLLRAITDREISLTPQSGDRLFNQGLGFAAIVVGGIGVLRVLRVRRGDRARRLVRRALGLVSRLRPDGIHQHHNRENSSHSWSGVISCNQIVASLGDCRPAATVAPYPSWMQETLQMQAG